MCEIIINDATISIRHGATLVASPPQHISPCATQLQDASALSIVSHTSQCATPMQTASARTPMPPPRQSKSKKITDVGYQCKNMSGSGEQHQDQYTNVPTPGQGNTKTSAVIKDNDTTSAPKGFNHLPQVKGEADLS